MLRIEIVKLVRLRWIDEPRVKHAARAAAGVAGVPRAARVVSIVIADDRFIRWVNNRTFGRRRNTDVIAFPFLRAAAVRPRGRRRKGLVSPCGSCPETMLGEIFVSADRAVAESTRRGVKPIEELLLYVVHGVLHLLGYDDATKADTVRMRSAEKRALAPLGIRPT